ncbi:MAG: 3-oxoacyl-ACP reductase [Gammaproteobacteria bacterium]|nr:3-oxoacyl-ACP reductase [Gammaproteobacteria bacterium]
MKTIDQQTILVTGGARGLGAAIARTFARAGATVAVNYFESADRAHALSEEFPGKIFAYQADVRRQQTVRQMVDQITTELGAPTVVIHNALASYQFNGDARDHLEALTYDAFLAQTEVGVGGLLNVMQACLPAMKAAGCGHVVVIGTNLVQHPVVPYHDYTANKAALLALVRTSAKDLGHFGIRVNMVSGGLLRTTDASAATPDAVFDLIAQQTPLGHVTTPKELADAVLFFASPWSRAITGQNLVVDGGLTCN